METQMMQTKNGSSGLDKNTPWKHSNSLLGWSIPESKIESVKSAWAFSCLFNLMTNETRVTYFDTINASTYLCGKLWWVKGCSHMDPLSSLHQPQLATWTSCDICYTKMCDTGLIHLMTLRCANSCDKVWWPRKRVVRLFESTHFVSPRIFQYVSVKSLQPLHRKL